MKKSRAAAHNRSLVRPEGKRVALPSQQSNEIPTVVKQLTAAGSQLEKYLGVLEEGLSSVLKPSSTEGLTGVSQAIAATGLGGQLATETGRLEALVVKVKGLIARLAV